MHQLSECKSFVRMTVTIALAISGIWISLDTARVIAQQQLGIVTIRSEVRHFGNAEARIVTKDSGFFPDRQPVVYWHDEDWQIDLTPDSSPNNFSLRITAEDKKEKTVKLPWDYSQINLILRGPKNKAIVIANINGMTQAFCVIDLREGKIVDGQAMYDPSVSPDNRFILYENWYPPHAGGESQYILYDLLRTPDENTCGFWDHDLKRKSLADEGIQIYPHAADHIECELEDEDDDNVAVSDFLWSTDSSKVVFADIKSGAISLILVTMSEDRGDWDNDNRDNEDRSGMDEHGAGRGRRDLPQTSIYTFTGADDVCAGAASCDYNNVKSVAWNGDAVNVALIQANPGGKAIEKDLTIPLTKFVPISNHRDHETGPGRHDGDHSDQGPGHE